MKRMLRSLCAMAAHERSPSADKHLGLTLAFIAGAVNAGGFLAVGRYTSHMTGIVSNFSSALVLADNHLAGLAAMFFFAFIAGATTASFILSYARARQYQGEVAFALMFEAFLLMVFSLVEVGLVDRKHILDLTIEVLCFIMGLQNAIITKITHRAIRTTHVTGISTDIGIELGRVLVHLFTRKGDADYDRLALNVELIIAFLVGGIIGAASYTYIGFITTIPLALVLVIIATASTWHKPAAG